MIPARPSGSAAACAEAERHWLEGSGDPVAVARIEAHLGRCPRCQQAGERLAWLSDDVRRAAPPLDDVTRARLLAELAPALDGIAATEARSPWRTLATGPGSGWRLLRPALLAGALLAVAGAALLLGDPGAPVKRGPASPSAHQAPVSLPLPLPRPLLKPVSPRAPAPASLALLIPGPGTGVARPGQPVRPPIAVSRLEQRRPGLMQARLGERARLALGGPGLLEVVAVDDEGIELRLTRGALVMDYDRRRGGRLKIHSPGAVTEVVGTLFSVEVTGGRSRVAVVRGRVSVEAAGSSRVLDPGQSLLSEAPTTQPLPAGTRALLRQAGPLVSRGEPRSPAPAEPALPPLAPSSPLGAPVEPPPSPAAIPAGEPPGAATAPPPLPAPAPAPTPAPAPPPAPGPMPALVAPAPAERYRLAEAAMQRGAWSAARSQLEALIAESARHPVAAVARYELAQIALRSGDPAGARRWLDELAGSGAAPGLHQSAYFLRCEVALATPDPGGARRCLRDFRAAFPASVNDALALGLLLRITPASEICGASRSLLDEFLSRFPEHRFAAELAGRRDRCSP